MTADLESGDSLGAEPEALMAASLATIPIGRRTRSTGQKKPLTHNMWYPMPQYDHILWICFAKLGAQT